MRPVESQVIGTPSGSENTGSSLFQSIPSQRSSIPSHPTSSPISFGPSTPVMSTSAAPAGLLSSPGGMSDVGGTLTPPGLPLSDPPRVSGIPSSDPIFGMSSGSLPCENSGQVPVPAQAPVVPPPPPPGVGDPFAQLLVGQSAMSQLMLQMAQEMQRRAMGNAGVSQHDEIGQGNNPGTSSGDSKKEMHMDEKWIPAMLFFLLYAAWVRSRAERPSVSYTKVVMEVAWTGHNLQYTKMN